MRALIRWVLWTALVSTASFFCLLMWLLPSEGPVAFLIDSAVLVALLTAGVTLCAGGLHPEQILIEETT